MLYRSNSIAMKGRVPCPGQTSKQVKICIKEQTYCPTARWILPRIKIISLAWFILSKVLWFSFHCCFLVSAFHISQKTCIIIIYEQPLPTSGRSPELLYSWQAKFLDELLPDVAPARWIRWTVAPARWIGWTKFRFPKENVCIRNITMNSPLSLQVQYGCQNSIPK